MRRCFKCGKIILYIINSKKLISGHWVVKKTGKLFKDEAHIIYVNSQIKDETKLGRLMHDFSCTNAKDMHNKVLADRVRYFKEDERGERSGDYVS